MCTVPTVRDYYSTKTDKKYFFLLYVYCTVLYLYDIQPSVSTYSTVRTVPCTVLYCKKINSTRYCSTCVYLCICLYSTAYVYSTNSTVLQIQYVSGTTSFFQQSLSLSVCVYSIKHPCTVGLALKQTRSGFLSLTASEN